MVADSSELHDSLQDVCFFLSPAIVQAKVQLGNLRARLGLQLFDQCLAKIQEELVKSDDNLRVSYHVDTPPLFQLSVIAEGAVSQVERALRAVLWVDRMSEGLDLSELQEYLVYHTPSSPSHSILPNPPCQSDLSPEFTPRRPVISRRSRAYRTLEFSVPSQLPVNSVGVGVGSNMDGSDGNENSKRTRTVSVS